MPEVDYRKTAYVVVKKMDIWNDLILEKYGIIAYTPHPSIDFTIDELETLNENMLNDPEGYTKTDFIQELVDFFDKDNFTGTIIFRQGW